MLISKENVPVLFAPFAKAIGACYDKVCNDAKAYYGRIDKDISAEGGDWKVKGKVSRGEVANKAVYTLLLEPNNPITPLTLAAMDAREMSKRHTMDVTEFQLPLPKACIAWIDTANKKLVIKPEEPAEEPANRHVAHA